MDQSIRKRKVPLQELGQARILANFKKATEKWSGKTFRPDSPLDIDEPSQPKF